MPKTNSKKTVGMKKEAPLNNKQKKEVKQIVGIQQEKKYTLAWDSLSPTTTPNLVGPLVIPIQGDTDTERSGDRIMIKSVEVRQKMACGDTTNMIRVIFFQWRPSVPPTIAGQILQADPITASITVLSVYSKDFYPDFKILYDKTHRLAGNGTANYPATNITTNYEHFFLKRFNKQIQYAAGGIVNSTNNIFLLIVSDSGALPNPTYSFDMRINYTDS